MKKRIDILLYEKGFARSRERSKRIIEEGEVFADGNQVKKPSEKYKEDVDIEVRENPLRYVGRGGEKLEAGIKEFNIDFSSKTCLDIGSSTGGFTDCMLQNGAKKVYAVDVGSNQLVDSLREDKRVVVMENTDIRGVSLDELVDIITIDVSFISQDLIVDKIGDLLKEDGLVFSLIKPQFELDRQKLNKRKLVTNKKFHQEAILKVVKSYETRGFKLVDLSYSPIKGGSGNIEFIGIFKRGESTYIDREKIKTIVEKSHKILS